MTTIYADNAATTQMSRAAIDAMLPYLETIYGNPSSLHSVGQQAAGQHVDVLRLDVDGQMTGRLHSVGQKRSAPCATA